MKKTAENTAAEAPAPFYVDYKQLYEIGLTNMRRSLERYNPGVMPGGRYMHYRDHRTISLYGNRQTGKTKFIVEQLLPTDLVVVYNSTMLDNMLQRMIEAGKSESRVVTAKDLVELKYEVPEPTAVTRVFVDDALVTFDRYHPRSIYKSLTPQLLNLDHFVLIG